MRTRRLGRAGAALLAVAGFMLVGAQAAAAQQPPGTQTPGTPTPGTQPPPITQPPGTPPSVKPPTTQGADLAVSVSGVQDCVNVRGDCEEHGVHVKDHTNYRLTVHITNGGPGTATNVRAQIRTPKEFEVERISPEVCDESRYCEIGTLESGQDAVITLRGEYADPARAHNWVFVASDAFDSDQDNNEAGQRGVLEERTESEFDCFGKEPTIRGTERSDVRFGTPRDDVIATFEGNDVIFDAVFVPNTSGGVDRFCSGVGDDVILNVDGAGDDFIDCGPGDDVALVGSGDVVRHCETTLIVDPFGSLGGTLRPGEDAELRSGKAEAKLRELLGENDLDIPREARKRIEGLLDR